MNYCPACHRHLNGALACAGCGTPAEYLTVAPTPGPAVPPAPQPALAEVFADSLVVLSVPGEGRAGTRRRAVTQRRRRRTVLTVGLGLLLATGGSMAVARIVTDDGGVDRAAEVVLADDAPKDPDPLPSLGGGPAAPSALPSAKAAAGRAKAAGAGGGPSGSAQPSSGASASAPGTAGPSQNAPGGGASVRPSNSGQPAPGPTGTAKQPGKPPEPSATKPAPTPTPKPTKSCVFWIFGCS
ncbi:SCO2400 family protein [Streptomyces lavendulae]|uniref:SCO2400 family protein n=1 Tax=Streptomyces lavendulae TaxID=1914 RepID=UPI0036E33B48